MNNNKKFCVTLEMTYFMKDHRSLCKLLIDRSKCKQIQHLHDHITNTFKITDFYLKCNNHYLPEKEDIDILQPGDELRVFPKLDSRCEKVTANVDSVTELITDEVPDIVDDIQTLKKKRRKRKRNLDVEEDPIPSGTNNGDLPKTDNLVEECIEINVKSRRDNEVEHEKQRCSTMRKQGADWYSKTADKISFFEGLSEKSDEVSPIEKRVLVKDTSFSPVYKANTLFFGEVRDRNDEVSPPKERRVLLKASRASSVSQATVENKSNIQLIEDIFVVPSVPVSSDEITPPPKTTKKTANHKTTPYPRLPPFTVGGLLSSLTKSSDSDRTIKNGNVFKRENGIDAISQDDKDNIETCEIPSIVNKRKRIRVRKRKTLPNVIECSYSNTTPVSQQLVAKTPVRSHIRFDIEEKEEEDLIDLMSERSERTDSGIGMNKSRINKNLPLVGNIISFKLLILSENYTPEISNYITATVTKFNRNTGDIEINVLEGKDELNTPIGIFTLEDEIEDNQNNSIYNWFKFIEPTIIYP